MPKRKIDKTGNLFEDSNIIERDIEVEIKSSYLDYSMSVIIGRALPDVRDGLKPVHRRILYTMDEMGLQHNKPYKKSARVVGEVLGKYHPHGDQSVYDALVRMAQDFTMRFCLVDGQGNFGSVDGDPPAAMRYTEVRLSQIASELLTDLDKDTVTFVTNYDGSLKEPSILPAKLPNLLLNGSSGIAVGMSTNIPPHNLGEICDLIIYYIDNNDIGVEDLLKIFKGPDFPTGGIICGRKGIVDYFTTGNGQIRLRAKTDFEEIRGSKNAIIIKELPYQVNKSQLLEKIANLVKEGIIEDISDIRDESDRDGMRVVIELKRDSSPDTVLKQLFRYTDMDCTYGVIMLALVDGKPRVLSLKEIIYFYIQHRKDIVVRRTKFELANAEQRAHILEGLRIAIDNLNKIIKLIRESKNSEDAKKLLMGEFELSQIQAQAILDMRLHQLTSLEREKLQNEYREVIRTIAKLKTILADPRKVLEVIRNELIELKQKYPQSRKTKIIEKFEEIEELDVVKKEDVVVTLSHAGYIKRISVETYKVEKIGGKGKTILTQAEDFIEQIFITNTHSSLLLFTSKGKVYSLPVYDIPEGISSSKGKSIYTILHLLQGEKITLAIPLEEIADNLNLAMATKMGLVKKISLSQFTNIRKTGIQAIKLNKDDILIGAGLISQDQHIMLITKNGLAIRFPEKLIRPMGRTASGVRGIKLHDSDSVIDMVICDRKDGFLLTVTEKGFAKKTKIQEFTPHGRGGKGMTATKITEKNGPVVNATLVQPENDVMVITEKGTALRVAVKPIPTMGRNTQGIRLMKLDQDDRVTSIANIPKEG